LAVAVAVGAAAAGGDGFFFRAPDLPMGISWRKGRGEVAETEQSSCGLVGRGVNPKRDGWVCTLKSKVCYHMNVFLCYEFQQLLKLGSSWVSLREIRHFIDQI
jgi:hypothetical protein